MHVAGPILDLMFLLYYIGDLDQSLDIFGLWASAKWQKITSDAYRLDTHR